MLIVLMHLCRNSGDKDKVWTFGSGPRPCIGHLLSKTILKVRAIYSTHCTSESLYAQLSSVPDKMVCPQSTFTRQMDIY